MPPVSPGSVLLGYSTTSASPGVVVLPGVLPASQPGTAFAPPSAGGTPSDPVQLRGLVSPSHTGDFLLVPAGTQSGQPRWSLDGTSSVGGNIILNRLSGGWTISANNALGSSHSQWLWAGPVSGESVSNPRGLSLVPFFANPGGATGTVTTDTMSALLSPGTVTTPYIIPPDPGTILPL